MLNLFNRTKNKLFEFIVPVTKGAACTISIDPEDGRIACYTAAADEDKARDLTVMKLQIARCIIHAGWQSREVDFNSWEAYKKTRWPRSYETLPSNNQVMDIVKNGGFFVAPVSIKNG